MNTFRKLSMDFFFQKFVQWFLQKFHMMFIQNFFQGFQRSLKKFIRRKPENLLQNLLFYFLWALRKFPQEILQIILKILQKILILILILILIIETFSLRIALNYLTWVPSESPVGVYTKFSPIINLLRILHELFQKFLHGSLSEIPPEKLAASFPQISLENGLKIPPEMSNIPLQNLPGILPEIAPVMLS